MTATVIAFHPKPHPRLPLARTPDAARTVLRDYCRRVEHAWERGLHVPRIDLLPELRRLPLLVQCAVRVHQQREARGLRLFCLDPRPVRPVLLAPGQHVVLVFSSSGVLAAAGDLVDAPTAPIHAGQRWTRIDWAADVTKRDWY